MGGDGNDTFVGGQGAAQIIGGAGDDTLIDGPGAQTFLGMEGRDTVDYSKSDKAVTVTIDGTPRKVILFKPDREEKDPQGESSRFVAEEAWPEGVNWEKVEITLLYAGKQWTLELDDH